MNVPGLVVYSFIFAIIFLMICASVSEVIKKAAKAHAGAKAATRKENQSMNQNTSPKDNDLKAKLESYIASLHQAVGEEVTQGLLGAITGQSTPSNKKLAQLEMATAILLDLETLLGDETPAEPKAPESPFVRPRSQTCHCSRCSVSRSASKC